LAKARAAFALFLLALPGLALAQPSREALEEAAKWHDEVAAEYKKEQLLYEERESWTVAYVFAQGYVMNKKRAAAIGALAKGDSVSLTPQQQSVMEKALMQSVESKGEGDD
jgi:hypothetical protein